MGSVDLVLVFAGVCALAWGIGYLVPLLFKDKILGEYGKKLDKKIRKAEKQTQWLEAMISE